MDWCWLFDLFSGICLVQQQFSNFCQLIFFFISAQHVLSYHIIFNTIIPRKKDVVFDILSYYSTRICAYLWLTQYYTCFYEGVREGGRYFSSSSFFWGGRYFLSLKLQILVSAFTRQYIKTKKKSCGSGSRLIGGFGSSFRSDLSMQPYSDPTLDFHCYSCWKNVI